MSFGGDAKSRGSLLSGVYAGRSKRSHTGGKCVDSTTLEIHHSCVSPRMGCFEYTYLLKNLDCHEGNKIDTLSPSHTALWLPPHLIWPQLRLLAFLVISSQLSPQRGVCQGSFPPWLHVQTIRASSWRSPAVCPTSQCALQLPCVSCSLFEKDVCSLGNEWSVCDGLECFGTVQNVWW